MSRQKAELKPKKYRVEIHMKKPIVITDLYPKRPTKNNVLENFADCIYHKMLEEHFEVVIKPVK